MFRTAKLCSRYKDQIVFDRFFTKSIVIRFKRFRKQVKSTIRFHTGKSKVGKSIVEKITVSAVNAHICDILVALLHKKLEHCRGVDVTEDTRCPGNCLFDRIKLINLRRHNKISHTLAGDGKTFAVRIAHKCIAIKVRDIRNFHIVGDFTVRLIRNDINCVAVFFLFFCQYFTYAFNRFFRINGTGRIVW